MKITSKGQVTIPQWIRDSHGLLPETDVDFIEEKGKIILVKNQKPSGKGRKLVERMRGRGVIRMSTDEIMRLTRSEV